MQTLQALYRHPSLSAANHEAIFKSHRKTTFKKGAFLLQKGQTAQTYFCIEAGLVRSYAYDMQGHDITTGFAGPGEIAIDVVSLFNRIPAVEYVQALTDCYGYLIHLDDFETLYHSIQGFSEWGRAWMAASLFRLKQRTTAMITDSASERYLTLQREHPHILQQAPLRHVASYLGITDSSLSRIRRELVK